MFLSGQHFLVNQSALKKIAEALDAGKNDVVIEIGAGHGELTEGIIKLLSYYDIKKFKIIAIEKDENLAAFLKEKFSENKNIEIVEGDVLKILPKLFNNLITNNPITKIKLVGNIPYYITGKLLRLISELENKPERAVFMLQKEVAERLAEKPPQMNRLAASVQFWAKPEIIENVSRNDFEPAPEVDSAVVALTQIHADGTQMDADKYYQAVRMLFQQPRKTILNNIAKGTEVKKETLAKKLFEIGINPTERPQNLSIGDIINIGNIV